jgi:hypothetical protein
MGNNLITLETCLGERSTMEQEAHEAQDANATQIASTTGHLPGFGNIKEAPASPRNQTNAPSSSSSYWEHITDDSDMGGFSLAQFRTIAGRKGGIPSRYRSRLWSATTSHMRSYLEKNHSDPSMWRKDVYDKLRNNVAAPSAATWQRLNAIPTESERSRIITEQLLAPNKDVLQLTLAQTTEWHRTMRQLRCDVPRNSLIGGCVTEERLVALCVAASVHSPNTGYMQGMDALAATLLTHLDDQDAFWSYLILINHVLDGYFNDSQSHSAMTFELWVFQELLKQQLPHVNYVVTHTFDDLFSAMETPKEYEGKSLTFPPIEISFNVFSWFVRCFASHLPNEHTWNVWDLMFSRMNEGTRARTVFHASALAIFHRLGTSIEEQGGDAYKSKSMKMVRK